MVPPMVKRMVVVLVGLGSVGVACSSDGPLAGQTTQSPPAPAQGLVILVTNDDGVGAPGIDRLVTDLTEDPSRSVVVVAPAENQSGSSDKTTPGGVTWSEAETASGYPAVAVDGSPADSVLVALDEMGMEPDLVISGINEGQNIGPLVEASGTVGAARTAARHGHPALAVSQGLGEPADFPAAAALALAWLSEHEAALTDGSFGVSVTNLNVPTCGAGDVRDVVEVPVANALGDRKVNDVDCTSTDADPEDDVDAFLNGLAPLSDLSFSEQGAEEG